MIATWINDWIRKGIFCLNTCHSSFKIVRSLTSTYLKEEGGLNLLKRGRRAQPT